MPLPAFLPRIARVSLHTVRLRTGPLLGMGRPVVVAEGYVTVGMPPLQLCMARPVPSLALVGLADPVVQPPSFKAVMLVVGLGECWSRNNYRKDGKRKDTHRGLRAAEHTLDRLTGSFRA